MLCPICKDVELKQDNTKTQFSFRCPDCNFNDGHAVEVINYVFCISQSFLLLDDHPSLIADGLIEEYDKIKKAVANIYNNSGRWQDAQKWDLKQ